MSEADVRRAVQKVAETIDESYYFLQSAHEYQTRYSLIDPVLRSLGWDTADVSQVQVEYDTGEGRVDYVLLQSEDGLPSIIVEAKSLGRSLQTAAVVGQLSIYAEATKTKGYAILTDGDIWRIYDSSKRGSFQNKLIVEVELDDGSNAANAKMFNQLLRRNLHWSR